MFFSLGFKRKVVHTLFHMRFGRDLWASDKEMMQKHGVECIEIHPECEVEIPAVPSYKEGEPPLLPAKKLQFDACRVIKLDYATHGDCVRRWGAIVLPGCRALHTGVNTHTTRFAAIAPQLSGKKRRENLIVAAWPHTFMSYGDFCMCVLPRVCRALSVLSEKERSEACVALPFSCGGWARQYMELLGISRDRQIDTLAENFGLAKGGVAVSVNEHTGVWAPPCDFDIIGKLIPRPAVCGKRRFYVQRKGARKLTNEKELFAAIEELGFEMLEDRPRTVREQIELFSDAECIVGAHGAGLSNVLWAGQGVRLMEVQGISWVIPSFRYVCAFRQIPYRVVFDERAGGEPRVEGNYLGDPLLVDVDIFKRQVESLCSAKG